MKVIKAVPLKSVGDIKFGMSRTDVRKIMGSGKEFKKSTFSKSTTDSFGSIHVFYNEQDKCEAVEIYNDMKVMIGSTPVFPCDANKVTQISNNLEEDGNGFIDKEKSIGITISDNKTKSILFAVKGYYN